MHVVYVSYYYDRFLTTPDALLARYETQKDWAECLVAAGAHVSAVQRFGRDAEIVRNGVAYRFVKSPAWRFGHLTDPALKINRAIVALRPDIVHVNGMHFVRQAARLKRMLPNVPVLVQDHAGAPPSHRFIQWTYREAMRSIDAVSFTVPEQTAPWREARILSAAIPLVTLPESSSRFQLQSQAEARLRTGLCGDPLCLFVGRLNANKDPLTILKGFGQALNRLPGAQLAMVYNEMELLPAVHDWLEHHPETAARVKLLGKMPHAKLEAIYNSADFFLLGSDYDGGSGYSVLEALSCGVVPLITNIPSFRAVTMNGEFGGLWPVGDADALAKTLLAWDARLTPETRRQVRAYFDAHLSFETLGRQAIDAYTRLVEDAVL